MAGYFDSSSSNRRPRILKPTSRIRLRYLFIPLFLFLILPALLLLGDRQYMHWKLGREIESRRARGEAVTLEDFLRPAIPDDINAAIPIRRVGGMARLSLKEEQCIDEVLF